MIPPLKYGRYHLGERLGGGGYAQAYLCRPLVRGEENPTGARWAIKIFNDPSYTNTFEQEVRMLQIMAGCPGLPLLRDHGRDQEGRLCLVTDCMPGIRLDRFVASGGRLSYDQAISLLSQILTVLSYAHARGVIHKDIKASNILMDQEHFTLLDWGVAEFRGDGRSETIRAKREYVAPECFYGSHDFATDFYSLAWLVLYAMTGMLPYSFARIRDPDYRVVAHCLERPQLPNCLASPLRDLLAHWLDKNPGGRIVAYDLATLFDRTTGRMPDFSGSMDFRQIERECGFLHLAARQGVPFAQYHFALRQLAAGRDDLAIYWLEAAAERGYARALYRLARVLARRQRKEADGHSVNL